MKSYSPIYQLLVPATPAAVGLVRTQLQHWLQRQHWPAEPSDDIEYAVSEAVSNAVEHAYPPGLDTATVAVGAEVEALPGGMRRVRVRVSDNGRWRPSPRHSGGRRLGITMMSALMDQVHIAKGDGVSAGTEVLLLSPPIPRGRQQ